MKKLLLFLALAAAGLQGWADDFYIVGNAAEGWKDGYSSGQERSASYKMTKDASIEKYTWTGFLKAADNGFKICTGSTTWAAWCASTDGKDLAIGETNDTPIYYDGDSNLTNDRKWDVTQAGYYEIILDLSGVTKSFKATFLPQDADETCLIGNANHLRIFAALVNGGRKTLNAKLTADIDMTGVTTYTPIGTDVNKYTGTFDGQGHRIKNLTISTATKEQGLFSVCAGGTTIKNLIMDSSCSITNTNSGDWGNAAFVAVCNGAGTLTIENCGNEANVSGAKGNNAGFVGKNYCNSGLIVSITNCYNTGNISGGTCNAAFIGDNTYEDNNGTHENKFIITNCYNKGTISNNDGNTWARRGSSESTINTCYTTETCSELSGLTSSYPDAEVASGELCYKLNGDAPGTNWTQNIILDVDSYPIPFDTHRKVYKNGDDYSNLLLSDGKYQIGSYDDLKDFSKLVASGNTSLNAKLTADITADNTYTPIGTTVDETDYKYAGEFDGNQKTVTLATNNGYSNQGLFGIVTGGANIHDLIVVGSVQGRAKVAGVVGLANGGGVITLTNVINIANVHSTGSGNDNANASGLVGCAANNTSIIMTNCANMGNVSGQNEQCAALAGWTEDYNGSKSLFINCWNSGTISNMENDCNLYRNTSKVDATNCYDVSGQASYTQGNRDLSSATLASGELCYKLNGDQKEICWYQNLTGTIDSYPVPFSSHSQVYPNAAVNCDGSSSSGDALDYTNTNTYSAPAHNYEDGWCTECNAYQENAITPNGEGWYCVSQPWQLRWLAESVNQHYNAYRSANIKLTSDIDYSAYKNEAAMFGWSDHPYRGTFDGQFHAVNVDFEALESETGLFRQLVGGTIKNLKVDGNITTNNQFAGGIVGGIYKTGVITNCVSAVKLKDNSTSGDGTHGGILGWVSDVSDITVSNCLFIGEVDAPNRTGCTGVVGWTADKETEMKVKNCLVLGTLKLKDENTNGIIIRSKADATDNYYICTVGTNVKKDGGINASEHNATPGELCYFVNGNTPYNTVWRQNLVIDADATPVPFNTHGIVNKISSVGYTTQYIPSTDVTIPEDVEAYAGVINGDWLRLVEIEDAISKNDAVVLKGTANTYYSFVPTTDVSSASSNDLKGSNGSVEGNASSIYALANLGDPAVVGFYLVNDGVTVPAGKAYLNTDAGVKGFTFVFDDDPDGIKTLSDSPVKGENIYNLAGQRISKMQKGINIVNGKKIMK